MGDNGTTGHVPGDGPGGATTFRIIQRGHLTLLDGDAFVRPCPHLQLVLDERWETVTCEDCRQQVSAFAALMIYVQQRERIHWEQKAAEDAQRDLMRRQAHIWLERRQFDSDRAHYERLLRHAYTLGAMREVHLMIGERVKQAKNDWRAARAAKNGKNSTSPR
jgi:hypothetical protein